MNAGILRHLIDIQKELVTQNDYGEPAQTWVTFLSSIRASVEPIRGREYFEADKVNAEISHRIKIRYRTGITTDMRVKFGVRYFDIVSVIDIQERHRELHLMCREDVSYG